MLARRCSLLAIVVTLGWLAFATNEIAAQEMPRGRGRGGADNKSVTAKPKWECPECHNSFDYDSANVPAKCPNCKAKIVSITPNEEGDGFRAVTETENPIKKYILYGGIGLLVVGLIGVALKYTVFAPAKPKKKKKRRDDDDDRPSKRRKPVLDDDDDEEEERPKRKKPRVVEEDDD